MGAPAGAETEVVGVIAEGTVAVGASVSGAGGEAIRGRHRGGVCVGGGEGDGKTGGGGDALRAQDADGRGGRTMDQLVL